MKWGGAFRDLRHACSINASVAYKCVWDMYMLMGPWPFRVSTTCSGLLPLVTPQRTNSLCCVIRRRPTTKRLAAPETHTHAHTQAHIAGLIMPFSPPCVVCSLVQGVMLYYNDCTLVVIQYHSSIKCILLLPGNFLLSLIWVLSAVLSTLLDVLVWLFPWYQAFFKVQSWLYMESHFVS